MRLSRVVAFTVIAIIGLGAQVAAQGPCPKVVRLRDAANEAWKHAMRLPRSERC